MDAATIMAFALLALLLGVVVAWSSDRQALHDAQRQIQTLRVRAVSAEAALAAKRVTTFSPAPVKHDYGEGVARPRS